MRYNYQFIDQILKHRIIQNRIEYFKAYTNANDDVSEDQSLLQTIKIPKNLLFLSDKLPQPNYEKEKQSLKNYHSFNDITNISTTTNNTKNQKKITDIKEIKEETMKEKDKGSSCSKRDISNDMINRNKEREREMQLKQKLILNKHQSGSNILEYKKKELPLLNIISKKQLYYESYLTNRETKGISKAKINHSNNEELFNLYKIYVPMMQSPIVKYKYRSPDRRTINGIDKYYDNLNMYLKPRKNIRYLPETKSLSKRKLSPLRRNVIKIC